MRVKKINKFCNSVRKQNPVRHQRFAVNKILFCYFVSPLCLFQGSVTLTEKDFCLMSRRDFGAVSHQGCAVARFVRACAFVNIVSSFIMSIPFNVFQVWSKSCFALRSFCCYKFLALFLFVSSRQTVIHVALNFFLRIIFLSPTMATMLVMQILDVSVRIECTVQFFFYIYMPFSVMKICWQLLADYPSSCGWLPQCHSFLLPYFRSFHPCHFVWPGFLCPSCIILHFEMLNSGTCPFVQLIYISFCDMYKYE